MYWRLLNLSISTGSNNDEGSGFAFCCNPNGDICIECDDSYYKHPLTMEERTTRSDKKNYVMVTGLSLDTRGTMVCLSVFQPFDDY